MSVGEAGEKIGQVGVRLHAVHLAGTDEAGEAGPIPAALVMAGEQRVATVHGRTSDGVLDQVGVHIDAAVPEEEPKAVLAPEHVGQRLTEVGLPRDTGSLRLEPGEEVIDQGPGLLLPDRAAQIAILAADGILDPVEGGDAH